MPRSLVLERQVVVGTLRRRLLVNAVVDPAEAASRLPAGIRPHVTPLGTVVGCCLLELYELRPAVLPAATGITLRAAAHRISATWDDAAGGRVVGVYVPDRRTDSRLAVALGGRWFPGVHRMARVDIRGAADSLAWSVQDGTGFDITVQVAVPQEQPVATIHDTTGTTCLNAAVGLSPGHDGVLESARMQPEHHAVLQVVVDALYSTFISSFATARPAPAYLMESIPVWWTPGVTTGAAPMASA